MSESDSEQAGRADRGNLQLVTVGNVSTNDRSSLILMDYPKRRRLKIFRHMRVEEADAVSGADFQKIKLTDYRAYIERMIFIDVAAFDWNCPQHITQRFTESEFAQLHSLDEDSRATQHDRLD